MTRHYMGPLAITRYTTWGPTRSCCGHIHQSEEAAMTCVERDQARCRRQGASSDRAVVVLGVHGVARMRRGDWADIGAGAAGPADDDGDSPDEAGDAGAP
jgi:hypothetical protein